MLLVSREHKGTSDEVSWAAMWVPDATEGVGKFPVGGCMLQRFFIQACT